MDLLQLKPENGTQQNDQKSQAKCFGVYTVQPNQN